MKSLNVKRIAAVAAGAAMLGAAFATAVTVDSEGVGNFKFFNNGEPGVKVVVGSAAMASDAVAAANIAAMLGNLAYTTAQVNAPASTGVQLEVTAPTSGGAGVTAGAYGFESFVNDNVDASAENVRTDTSSTTGLLTGVTTSAKKISDDQTVLLSLPNNGKLAIDALDITEEQNVYLNAHVMYGTADDTKQLIARQMIGAYEVTFSDSLPYCLDTARSDATCVSDNDKFEMNSKSIYVFGEPWTVSNMSLNASGIHAITLGKSSADLNNVKLVTGQELIAPNGVHIKVTDVTAPGYGSNNLARVGFDFVSADGASTVSKGVNELETLEKLGVNVKVESVVGSTAYVSVYADELELTSGSDIPDHGDWKVLLTAQNNSASSGISRIKFYTDTYPETSRGDNDFRAGESTELITGSPSMKITFKGLDLGDSDYDSLTFDKFTDSSKSVFRSASDGSATAMTGTMDFIRVRSDRSDAFQFTSPVTASTNEVYVAVGANTTTADGVLAGQVLFESAGNWYNTTQYSSGNGTALFLNVGAATTVNLPYYYSGDSNEGAPQNITFYTQAATKFFGAVAANDYVQLKVFEAVNESQATNTATSYWNATYKADSGFKNSASSDDSDKLTAYVAVADASSSTSLEQGFTSSRGSKLASMSSGTVKLNYAKKLGHAVFELSKSASSVVTASGASVVTANSDGTVDVGGGYMVKVASGAAGQVSQTQVVALNPSTSPLVVLDSQASDTQPLIVVGGPFVNTVAQGMAASADLKQNGDAVVKVEGTKMLVAGWSAADTTDAANALISWLSSNRDTVRGGQ